jgi:hypothetical protein
MASGIFEEKVRTTRILLLDEEIRSGSYPNTDVLAAKAELDKTRRLYS